MRLFASAVFAFAGATCTFFIAPQPALAWGEFGHLTVCDVTYRNLTDNSRTELKKIFRAGQGGITVLGKDGTERRHYTSFNVGCLEEGETRRRHPEDHFVNLDRATAICWMALM